VVRAHAIHQPSLTALSRQVGRHISRPLGPQAKESWWAATHGAAASPILCESFQVWALGTVAMRAVREGLAGMHTGQRLIEYAENTRYWHHQIRSDGVAAVGFAESLCEISKAGRERWRVKSVTFSPIAGAIDAAIKRIDRLTDLEEDDLVRLLIVPGMGLYAFWLESTDTDRILVASSYTNVALSLRRPYHWYAFLRALARSNRAPPGG
jgi:hypothetical protein